MTRLTKFALIGFGAYVLLKSRAPIVVAGATSTGYQSPLGSIVQPGYVGDWGTLDLTKLPSSDVATIVNANPALPVYVGATPLQSLSTSSDPYLTFMG